MEYGDLTLLAGALLASRWSLPPEARYQLKLKPNAVRLRCLKARHPGACASTAGAAATAAATAI